MFSTRRGERHDAGYVVTDGVAVIHASGALVHRSRFDMADCTYFQGYNELSLQLETAMSDPAVHAVLQVFDSPGGEVSGAFEYADRVMALRGQKPMWAIADNLAASAAYLGGSAFEQLAVSQTGYVGSIGVVMRHVDMSRRLASEGLNVTHIYAGAHKVDGNAYEPLPREVQSRLQDEVNALYELFVAAVVRQTGLTAAAVRATQAETFRGQIAVDKGLAHRVATTDQLISELSALRARTFPAGPTARSTTDSKGASMSGTTQGGQTAATPQTAASASATAFTQADLDAARAAGLAQGRTEGAAAERDRIAAVRAQSLPGHEALIDQLAADGHTTGPQAAAAVLAAERNLREAQASAEVSDAPKPAKAAAATDSAQPAKRLPNASAAYNALNRRTAA
jgi:signal peptide peptidase SppA